MIITVRPARRRLTSPLGTLCVRHLVCHPPPLWLQALQTRLLARWSQPHRYLQLNALERVLLATATGPQALARLAADMRQRLAAQKQEQRSRCGALKWCSW